MERIKLSDSDAAVEEVANRLFRSWRAETGEDGDFNDWADGFYRAARYLLEGAEEAARNAEEGVSGEAS
jgi:hypothetical protein